MIDPLLIGMQGVAGEDVDTIAEKLLVDQLGKTRGAIENTCRGSSFFEIGQIGWRAAENRVSVANWHATILRLLGMNNEHLFFESHGFKERITGVEKVRVVKEIFS